MCPDFPTPPGGGATAAQVWAYGTRGLTGDAANAIRDAILSDATKIPGANVDAAVSSRSSHAAAAIWSVATRAITDKAGFGLSSQAFPFTNPGAPVDLANVQQALSPTGTGREAKVDKIQQFIQEATGSLLMDGLEQIVKEILTTVNKLHCFVDLTPMLALDTVVVRQYMKIASAGAYVKYAEETYNDAQSLPLLYIVTKPANYGIKVTLQQSAGTYRTLAWETFQEKAA